MWIIIHSIMLWEGNDIIANLYDPPVYFYAWRRADIYTALSRLSYTNTIRPIKYLMKYCVDGVVDVGPVSHVFIRHEYHSTGRPHIHLPLIVTDFDDRSDESDLDDESVHSNSTSSGVYYIYSSSPFSDEESQSEESFNVFDPEQ